MDLLKMKIYYVCAQHKHRERERQREQKKELLKTNNANRNGEMDTQTNKQTRFYIICFSPYFSYIFHLPAIIFLFFFFFFRVHVFA